MVREVILRRRKPDIASLAYSRPQTPSERAAAVTAVDWDQVISFYVRGGPWSRYAGPEPGMGGCRAPREMLPKYGIVI
jgi:hypothetical protein